MSHITRIDDRLYLLKKRRDDIKTSEDKSDPFYVGVLFRLEEEIEFLEYIKEKGIDY